LGCEAYDYGRRFPWLAAILFGFGCSNDGAEYPATSSATAFQVPRLTVEVIRRLPHDASAYTQGLVFHDGHLFESTGRYGSSTIRMIDPATGAVLRQQDLPAEVFGEGLAATADKLVQLTWKELTAYVYDPATFEIERELGYQGEGWGLCFDGLDFYMTSGGTELVRRDAVSFKPLSTLTVRAPGSEVSGANELECVGDHVWANVYPTTAVIQIEKQTGRVVAAADLSTILPPYLNARDPDYVPNGIAHDPATGSFFVTGKLWPQLLEVRFRAETQTPP
jgi:glutaminyl-peptide cyclotransferase